ncbi:MAG: PLP-dependent aminotransferase family protein [Clostridia bacterium]|nr:PLP-dependent aminotransferase family protein [Clostridia bacterium]
MNYKISDKFVGMKPSAIREIFKSLGTPGAISFSGGNPAPDSFPVKEFAAISAEILEKNPVAALQYSVTEGYPKLRELVADRLKTHFNIGAADDTTIITTGGQQAIELTCKVLCNEGDVVIAENPSFIGALNAFRSCGAKLVGVELEDDGISLEGLEAALKANPNTKMIYLIPTFQNPGGITTSLEKRKAVYELARKYDTLIFEDNPYGELRFAGEEVPTIKSMDTDGRVIYGGSFSKVLSAGMRIGFLCANEALVAKIVVAKQVEDVHTNIFFQMICAEYLSRYDMDTHIEEIRALYRHKAQLMLSCLEKELPSCVKFTKPEGGIFLWCTLPDGLDMNAFVKAAVAEKVFVVPGTAFNCDQDAPSQSFRLNYSMPSDDDIVKGTAILGRIIKDMLAKA